MRIISHLVFRNPLGCSCSEAPQWPLTRSTASSREAYNYIVNDTHMQTLPTVPPLWYDQKRVNSSERVRQISYNLSLLQSLLCVLRCAGVIRLLLLLGHLYLTTVVWLSEDQRTNTIKTHVFKRD